MHLILAEKRASREGSDAFATHTDRIRVLDGLTPPTAARSPRWKCFGTRAG